MSGSTELAAILASTRRVLEPGVTHRTWDRGVDPDVAACCNDLRSAPWFDIRVRCTPATAAATVDRGLVQVVGDRPRRRAFVDDISVLADLLAGVAGSDRVDIRVEHGPGGTCPVFHQDQNVLRLLCTYVGPGTEWLPDGAVDRSQLGLRGRTPDEANRAIVVGRPVRANCGEVIVAKGAGFGEGAEGLVHRSPSIALGERVLVAIDPVVPQLTDDRSSRPAQDRAGTAPAGRTRSARRGIASTSIT